MKISRIKVENFRSIEQDEFRCSSFNILVGQNNAGKTNLFEAIEWFYNGTSKGAHLEDLKFRRETSREIVVEIEFVDAQHGIEHMKNSSNKTKMTDLLGESDSIVIRRSSSDPKKRRCGLPGGNLEDHKAGMDTALNDFLPKFEYINTKQYFDAVAKFSNKTPVGIMLSSVLETILDGNKQYTAFKEKFDDLFESDESEVKVEFDKLGQSVKVHLAKQFADTTSVKFEVQSPAFEDLLKNFETTIDDGVETFAAEKGDGMQRALMLAIIQAYADFRKEREDAGKSFLFFIDEAELHLHPTAQRRLKAVLLDLCQDLDQVFINTHSSVFVADDHETQTIYQVEKAEGKTNFRKVDAIDKPYVVFDLLGGSPADLLLPRNFLIVEGPSEVIFLTHLIRRFYGDKPPIQLVPAEGDTHQSERSINAIRKTFSPLNNSIYEEKFVVLCDKPTGEASEGFKNFLKEFDSHDKRGQIFQLPECSLEESYPSQWSRTSEEVKRMKGGKKKKLALEAGSEIKKEQFEGEMERMFAALQKAWGEAY